MTVEQLDQRAQDLLRVATAAWARADAIAAAHGTDSAAWRRAEASAWAAQDAADIAERDFQREINP